jgi:hypothetical protein
MVQQNNSYSGLGQSCIDAYIRNVEELRRGIENSLLPIVGFFVANSESQSNPVLPLGIMADNKDYLKSLGKKYFKRDFDFTSSDTERLKVYDILSNLIYRSRKTYQYAYCDLMDILFLKPKLFEDVVLPAHVIYNSKINVGEYNHKLPKSIEEIVIPKELSEIKPSIVSTNMLTKPVFDVAIHNKFPTPAHLYSYVLSDIKKSIDFEILKLYDYLCENDDMIIHSNKMLKIYEELKYIGEIEYTKVPFKTTVLPANNILEMSLNDICLDELSANIARGIDAKTILAMDLVMFMNHPEGRELKNIFHKGYYPELQALVHQYKR